MSKLWTFRPAAATDAEYLHKSWIESFRRLDYRRFLGRDGLGDYSTSIIFPLLGKLLPIVACSKTDPDFILGWAIAGDDTLHYVCVRQKYQRNGIARELLQQVGPRAYFSCACPHVPALVAGMVFRPLRALEGLSHGKDTPSIPSTRGLAHDAAVGTQHDEHRAAHGIGLHAGGGQAR